MASKKNAPAGADVLYSAVVTVEERDGLVFIELRSGAHCESGSFPRRVATQLYNAIGAVLRRGQDAPVCMACADRALEAPTAH